MDIKDIIIDRKEHIIKTQSSVATPRLCIYVDTETKLIQYDTHKKYHKLLLGCADFVDYQGRLAHDSIVFTNETDFWEWALSKVYGQQKLWIFAHNAAFDFRVLQSFTILKNHGYYVHKLIAESHKFFCTLGNFKKEYTNETVLHSAVEQGVVTGLNCNVEKIRNVKIDVPKQNRKTIQIVNTGNFFKFPLATLGNLLSLPKLQIKFNTASLQSLETYCKRDVQILRCTIENYFRFIREHRLGRLMPTIASQALCAFKTSYLTHKIHIHNNVNAIQLERNAFCGGRTEAFYIGIPPKDKYYLLDINSQYPYVMKNNVFPTRLIKIKHTMSEFSKRQLPSDCQFISYGRVTTNKPVVPVKTQGKLIFPVGKFYAALCQPEIDLLRKEGGTFHESLTAAYEMAPIFKEYSTAMNELKEKYSRENNEVYRMLAKLFGNSLFGKFSQHTEIWDLKENTDEYITECFDIWDYETSKTEKYKVINGDIYKYEGLKEGFDTFVAISSFITSYARVELYKYIKFAGFDNIFYSDTDSLIVNSIGYERLKPLIDKHKLGKLKLESTANEFTIYGLKDYFFDGKLKIKGIKNTANISKSNYIGLTKQQQKIVHKYRNNRLSYESMLSSLRKANVNETLINKIISTFDFEQWEGFNGGVRNKRLETVLITDTIKHLNREYTKGEVLPNGRVIPFELDDF